MNESGSSSGDDRVFTRMSQFSEKRKTNGRFQDVV